MPATWKIVRYLMTSLTEPLLEGLPLRQRLALAYAPAPYRLRLLGFLALDQRLAGIVRHSHEPMLAQLRLAWWRDQLSSDGSTWPSGDPLLGLLRHWQGGHGILSSLADGWEAMTGAAPLPSDSFEQLAQARAEAFSAVADNSAGDVMRLGRNWALADIAARLSHPEERQSALRLAQRQDWRSASLPRALRPLAVLHGLAARDLRKGGNQDKVSPLALLTAMRIGLTGF